MPANICLKEWELKPACGRKKENEKEQDNPKGLYRPDSVGRKKDVGIFCLANTLG